MTCYYDGEDEWGDTIAHPCDGKHKAIVGHTIAVDPDIIPYGTEVKIGNQIFVAEDCGGAVRGNVIDVWVGTSDKSFGVKNLEIFVKNQ